MNGLKGSIGINTIVGKKPILIAGPCVYEGGDHLYKTAGEISNIIRKKKRDMEFFFKCSLEKDNRTRTENFRGSFDKNGIIEFRRIVDAFGFKVCTDFHSVEQIEKYGQMFDMIQIPAFLSRQLSLLEAVAQTGSIVHIKKMQSAPPNDIHMAINVLKNSGARRIIATDRGTSFGYNQIMFDPRHVPMMKLHADEVLVDITHMNKYHSRWYWEKMDFPGVLAKSAMAAGADGLFMEVHTDPKKALCDAQTQLTLEQFKNIISTFL